MANKIAMSKALGAAFLNHQVEQLEKTVSNGPASGNWRDRRLGTGAINPNLSPSHAKRSAASAPAGKGPRKKAGDAPAATRNSPRRDRADFPVKRRSIEPEKVQKDADVIVADASVLINGLEHLKRWGRSGREEVVIVPLEGNIDSPSSKYAPNTPFV
jgi:hypothetical protein